MPFSVYLAQCNFIVGDIAGNVARIADAHANAARGAADLALFSEMAITGYPPEDLVLRRRFQDRAMDAISTLAGLTKGAPAMLVGGLWRDGDLLYNSVFFLADGKLRHRQCKRQLPNYGVFDEKRVFRRGGMPEVVEWRGTKLGILVCEDMWTPDMAAHLAKNGARILLVSNASPYEMGKARLRREVAQARVLETGLPLIYANQVGGQDELVFDGRSFGLSAAGETRLRLRAFQEDSTLLRLKETKQGWEMEAGRVEPPQGDEETICNAMTLGLRDYVEKNRFPGVVLGLSGGIDSALTAAVAVDAIGHSRVRALMMPSPYTSRESVEDAAECARRLGIRMDTIPIEPGMKAFADMLGPLFRGTKPGLAEENIQPRLRGALLMGVSNKEGLLLLTTGNKSEMSVGYATLYGDMCGGYSVLKDVYKTTVYKIARWRNAKGEVIPPRVFEKAPTAELKPGQKDEDTLPPYPVLDAILLRLVEEQLSVADIVAEGFDGETVEKVARMLYAAEYKRRQAPPGVKITGMSFGRDRRYPMTNGWRG